MSDDEYIKSTRKLMKKAGVKSTWGTGVDGERNQFMIFKNRDGSIEIFKNGSRVEPDLRASHYKGFVLTYIGMGAKITKQDNFEMYIHRDFTEEQFRKFIDSIEQIIP